MKRIFDRRALVLSLPISLIFVFITTKCLAKYIPLDLWAITNDRICHFFIGIAAIEKFTLLALWANELGGVSFWSFFSISLVIFYAVIYLFSWLIVFLWSLVGKLFGKKTY